MLSPQELVFEKQTLAASRIKGHGNLPESSTMSHKHLLNELTWLVQKTIRSWFLVQRSCVPGSNCLSVAHMYILAGVSYVLTFQEILCGLLHTCYDVLAHFTINQSYWKKLLTFMICEILNKNRSVHLALLTVMSLKLFVVTCLVAYLFNACFYSCQYS